MNTAIRRHFHPGYLLALLFMLVLASCAQLGILTPVTFTEKANAAEQTVTTVRLTGDRLLTVGKINAAQAQHVQDAANVARKGIDAARVTNQTNAAGAASYLDAIVVGLNALAATLATQGATP